MKWIKEKIRSIIGCVIGPWIVPATDYELIGEMIDQAIDELRKELEPARVLPSQPRFGMDLQVNGFKVDGVQIVDMEVHWPDKQEKLFDE